MQTSKEYKAIKNFFHNDLGLSREEIRKIAVEAIKEEAQSVVHRFVQTKEISVSTILEDQLKKEINRLLNGSTYNSQSRELMGMIGTQIAKQIEIKVKV